VEYKMAAEKRIVKGILQDAFGKISPIDKNTSF